MAQFSNTKIIFKSRFLGLQDFLDPLYRWTTHMMACEVFIKAMCSSLGNPWFEIQIYENDLNAQQCIKFWPAYANTIP